MILTPDSLQSWAGSKTKEEGDIRSIWPAQREVPFGKIKGPQANLFPSGATTFRLLSDLAHEARIEI